ncbi:hypothetical protein [Kitasatospora cineracea]|uniref:hypothetical protein n=1 Tax=Kitasatospora cineracea TaxID=88074 RepID=UPI00380B0402
MTGPEAFDLPVRELPIQIFPRPCEGAESFITRLAAANFLKAAYLQACLSEPPTEAGSLSWSRLAVASGRDLAELQALLERTPPPSPDPGTCEYCGRLPKRHTDPGPPPWWCSARCRRRSDLLATAPSSRGVLPGQRETLTCPGCGTSFVRPANSTRIACTKRCHARSVRAAQAELALYENPNAIEDDEP